ncbi:hypothetical protein TNCV_2347851 [Trichonephila clavipes]|nr:hypothetical protein TNCV_2347851 [Trichonephila clavipes]
MFDAEIIAVSTRKEKEPGSDEDVNAEDTVQNPKISHNEGLKAVETTFEYFEQQGASVIFVMKEQNAECSKLLFAMYSLRYPTTFGTVILQKPING